MSTSHSYTAKQRVLARFPKAICYRDKYGNFQITEAKLLGGGLKEKDAWADAAKRLDATHHERKP